MIPYVYVVKNKTTGLKYIGAKYSKDADPRTFWISYFTSSKHVKKLISIFGKGDFTYKILKTFDGDYECLQYERSLLEIAMYREDYLNLHANFLTDTQEQHDFLKEKQRKVASFYGNLTYLLKIGIHGLSDEDKRLACSKGGGYAADINRRLGRAIFDPDVRAKQHETLRRLSKSAFYDPELRQEISSKGGKVGAFSKAYYLKIGLTEDDRIKAQSERGKRGGKGNKGFRWYNDGKKSFKYTNKEQEELPFDEYIKLNGYQEGRISVTGKNRIWVNDGTKNMMIFRKDFDKNIHSLGRLGDKSKYGIKNKKH